MKTSTKNKSISVKRSFIKRRDFLRNGIIFTTLTGFTGIGALAGCKEETEDEITPSEDLMREHGVLNRILLIYDTCKSHLINQEQFDLSVLNSSAQIIRTFIENYHEKLEEDHLFPRFEKANVLTDLVKTLRIQHNAGRTLTDQILQLSKMKSFGDTNESQQLITLINKFNTMYRPHEAREDTVLFPVIRKIISSNEYYALGEEFEEKEHQLFGEDGFDVMVDKVANLEKQLGIHELSIFTPTV